MCWCRSVMSVASRLNSAGVKSGNLGISKMLSRSMARFVIEHYFVAAFSNSTNDNYQLQVVTHKQHHESFIPCSFFKYAGLLFSFRHHWCIHCFKFGFYCSCSRPVAYFTFACNCAMWLHIQLYVYTINACIIRTPI